MLHFDQYGAAGQPRLLIAHGLFGSARNWRAIAKRLSHKFHITVVDMRNHGRSPFRDEMTYTAMAEDLAEVIAKTGAPASVLGHSMGGKAAMALALSEPDHIEKLIIADIAPVSYSHSQMPVLDAIDAVDLSNVTRRSDIDAALARTLDDPAVRAFVVQSLELTTGPARWCLNTAALRAHMPEILAFPTLSGQFLGETLFVTGALSDYVTEDARVEIAARFAQPRYVALKNAGHWLHADQPRAFIATVDAFLSA